MPAPPNAPGGAGGGLAARKDANTKSDAQPGATSSTGEPLSKEQQAQVRELKKRDAEVKAHEQAHAAVGGAYASAPKYTYTRGPDGKKYAVGGEVQIDTSPERTPEATIRKMDIVVRAALAPAEPSSQDRAVARQAQQQRLEAQQQLMAQQNEERGNPGRSNEATDASAQAGVLAQLLGQANSEVGPTPSSDSAETTSSASAAAAAAAAYQASASLANALFGSG